jgi:translation initiation factor IF-2
VSGWKELPAAGDQVIQAAEDEVKRAVINRKRNHDLANLIEDVGAINEKRRLERGRREEELEAAKEALSKGQALPPKPLMRSDVEKQDDGVKYLRLIIKADVSGSAEAVAGALEGIGNDKAKTKIISYQVGNVSEGDITMARATEGLSAPVLGCRQVAHFITSFDRGVQCERTAIYCSDGTVSGCTDYQLEHHLQGDGSHSREGGRTLTSDHRI